MATTRSAVTKSRESVAEAPASTGPVEALKQQLAAKERELRELAESLARQKAEINEQKIAMNTERARLDSASKPLTTSENLSVNESLLKILQNMQIKIDRLSATAPAVESDAIADAPRPARREPADKPELSPLRLRDVAETIPRYDGQRISVFQFSQACERALRLIPSHQEPYLIQLILGKLQGHALTAVGDYEYQSVAELLRKLKMLFGPNKSLNQYKGELGNVYMRHSESVFDYLARVKEIRAAILDCEIARSEVLDQWTVDEIENDVLESFVNGLPPELLIRLKIDKYRDLDDAAARAVQLSKTLEIEAQRRKPAYTPRFTNLPRRDAPRPPPLPNPEDRQPRYIQPRPNAPLIKPLVPGQPGPNGPRNLICYYCKTPGHVMSQCVKRPANRDAAPRSGDNAPPPRAVAPAQMPSGNETRVPTQEDVRRDTDALRRLATATEVTKESSA